MRPLNETNIRRYQRRISRLLDAATPSQIVAGSQWYDTAAEVAQRVAENLGIDLERGAAIVSAFSPNTRWSHNVRLALQYSQGLPVATFRKSIETADRSRLEGFGGLRGPKTRNFAEAIAGIESAIVVDIWLARAAGLTTRSGEPTDAPTPKQYREVSAAILRESRRVGLPPRTTQAIAWIVIRGSAN